MSVPQSVGVRRSMPWSSSDVERIVPGTPEWDRHYSEHIQRYEFVARQLVPGMRVLDAGCGCGYGAAFLNDRGADSVVAVDLSAEALGIGRTQFHRPGITWVQEDCEVLEVAGHGARFDLVCNLENFEHLPDPERFLARVVELMLPQGVFVTSTPNRIGLNRLRAVRSDVAPLNPFHFREFTAEEFRTVLAKHFGDVTLAYQTYAPIERLEWEPLLTTLWNNPAARLGRWLQRAARRRPVVERVEELLLAPRYQILETFPGDDLVLVQLALCRAPRRADALPAPPVERHRR